MRFDRIYLGAGADETMAAILFRMLEMGGILIGPFSGTDGSQRLLKVSLSLASAFCPTRPICVEDGPLTPRDARSAATAGRRRAILRRSTVHPSALFPSAVTQVRRLGETAFEVRELMHVTFTPLVPATFALPATPHGADSSTGGLSDPASPASQTDGFSTPVPYNSTSSGARGGPASLYGTWCLALWWLVGWRS